MCGFLAVFEIEENLDQLRDKVLGHVKKLRHRGPDWSGIYDQEGAILAHERLSIVDIEHGAQPLLDPHVGNALAVNGEIYNHQDLKTGLKKDYPFQTASDCEVILALYQEQGVDFLTKLNGIFAFALYNPKKKDYLIARDPIGVIPLYTGRDQKGQLWVASEMKALQHCNQIEEFPPGHYKVRGKEPQRYFNPNWLDKDYLPINKPNLKTLKELLSSAVKKQLMCDVPYGLLISGGLDSSLISSIVTKFAETRVENDKQAAWWPRLHSFSIGLEDSPDLPAAQKVADAIGSVHHSITYTIQEGLDAISDVIYHLETFDVTTIRAATPMYLMARRIKSMGIKMVLSGEGADELFGGYLYFHKAPNASEMQKELVRKVTRLHLYDCLRANKAMSAWGVEARVPFLDVDFVNWVMDIDPAEKMITQEKAEKYILRKAFHKALPEEILWRQKEQFSDGVGYSWIDSLKEKANEEVTDRMMEQAAYRFQVSPPQNKEEYWYRSIFEEHFPNPAAVKCVPSEPSIACSTATALKWDKYFQNMKDPSGRSVNDVHNLGINQV